jgi:hypothetical protein
MLPDGSTAPVRFGDDADELTGDVIPKDGTFSALFDETHDVEGIYTFQVEVTSDGSSAFYPDETERPVPGDAENTTPIPAFVRRLSLSLVVGEEKIREPKSEDSDEPKHDSEPTSY